ncbi:hypothetical protein [Flavobacterium sp.]|uniref:hypothetical protein n=1 Tax=Flavobacterium sp. TaxID=239 RepID=UPI00404849EA
MNKRVKKIFKQTPNEVKERVRRVTNDYLKMDKPNLLKKIECLRLALDEIANPIKYLQKEAEEKGEKLNGIIAIELSKDHYYPKSIAKKALYELEKNEK